MFYKCRKIFHDSRVEAILSAYNSPRHRPNVLTIRNMEVGLP